MRRERRPQPGVAREVMLLLALNAGSCTGGDPGLRTHEDVVSSLLFSGTASKLSVEERTTIAGSLGLVVSPDGTQLLDVTCGQPVSTSVRVRDLNADGRAEVVVDWGNTCTSGMAGTSVAVFVKDVNGRYNANLGVPGLIAEVRPAESGFADLLVGGPGFCFGLWRWNGVAYAHVRNEPQAPEGCENR